MSILRDFKLFKINSQRPQCNRKAGENKLKQSEVVCNKKCLKDDLKKSVSDTSTIGFIRSESTFKSIKKTFSEYLETTSIHGIKYLGNKDQSCFERIFWFLVITISVYICVVLTLSTYSKWRNNPVIVSLAESSTPIWEVPFPAVTICPLAKSRREKFAFDTFLNNFFSSYERNATTQEISEEEMMYFNAIFHVCLQNSKTLKNFNFKNSIPNQSLPNIIANLAPKLWETFYSVSWRKNTVYSTDISENLINEVITEDGLCFSFNSFNKNDIFRHILNNSETKNIKESNNMMWSLEDGYSLEALTDVFPRRVLAGDINESLDVKLLANLSDSDAMCSGKLQGFKVILHIPGEFPQVSKRFFRLPYKHLLLVSVKPNMITTSSAVKQYDSSKRQCFFNNERYLRFFKLYTQGNCEHECIVNATIKYCGCLKMSIPKIPNLPYCGISSITCYTKARMNLLRNDDLKNECNCLPACTSIAYDAEVTQSTINQDSVIFGNITQNDDTTISVMKIFFISNYFLSSKRSELYGLADLIANIGGLFGLFMGVSILSLVEIIYFCTIRLIVNLKMRREAIDKINNDKHG